MLSNKNIALYLILAFILHIAASMFSTGFYNDDEHFQILEPTGHLLGLNEEVISNKLDPERKYWAWKSDTRMRTWLQPYIFSKFIKLFEKIGVVDPFKWVFIIKFFLSILGFISIVYFFYTFKNIFFKSNNHFNYLIFFSFWFYPFLHSRTSSENLSISIFIISLCYLYKQMNLYNYKFSYFGSFFFSFLLGISLVIRFNLIFTVFPCLLWVIFFKFNFYKIFIMSTGLVLALFFGLYIDSLFWGTFSNTYWNNYYFNIIEGLDEIYVNGVLFNEGMMTMFGKDPWWYYLKLTLVELAPPLSLIFIISLIIFIVKNPKNIFSWISLFTLISISSFSHKETRYIFPIYFFAPFFVSYFFEFFSKIKFQKFLKFFVLTVNAMFLIVVVFTPSNGKVDLYYNLYKNYSYPDNVYFIGENPYLINEMEPKLYTSFLPSIEEFKNNLEINNNYWIITKDHYEYKKILKNVGCLKKYSTYPEYIINLNPNWKRLKLNWYLINCNEI